MDSCSSHSDYLSDLILPKSFENLATIKMLRQILFYQHTKLRGDMEPVTAAYCGLYCGSCPIFRQTEDHLKGKIEKPSVICRGCRSDVLSPWCSKCSLKDCAKGKSIRFCFACSDFPCDNLNTFANDPNYPYHKEILENLQMIKNEGIQNWLKQQKERWSCSTCQIRLNWRETACPECGKVANGYANHGE